MTRSITYDSQCGATTVFRKASGVALILIIGGCYNPDRFEKASRTAHEVSLLAQLCERLNERGFDFASVRDIREFREAAIANNVIASGDLKADFLLKTPYGGEYKYRFGCEGQTCFAEVAAEVPDYVPQKLKDEARKRVIVTGTKASPASH
jgi:hypothetical protein